MKKLIQSKNVGAFIVLPVALAFLVLSQRAQAVSPAPDGGYPGNNTAEGTSTLFSLTSGIANTALGFQALYSNTASNYNTAEGFYALFSNTSGAQNTTTGSSALVSNTTGSYNTANGVNTLYGNTIGSDNTASGARALFYNSTGSQNTASGVQALFTNTTGGFNTANGAFALFSNTTGSTNTANGYQAANSNTAGDSNTANGYQALFFNTIGDGNTANGYQALFFNPTGSNNIALGYHAGYNVGLFPEFPGYNNIEIGNAGDFYDNNTIRIGGGNQTRTFIAGIRGVTTGQADAIPVVIDSAGQLGTMSSSRRFKKDIKPMDQASDAILALKPVTFEYTSDKTKTPQFGLIAEEVAQVNPDLVVRDKNGEIYTVRYEAVNAMLLNEFLKEHRKVEQLTKDFESKLGEQQKQIEGLTAGLQKMSAQLAAASPSRGGLEMSKPASKTVVNSQ